KPLDIREQYEKQLKELQEAYGEAMLELRARKKLASLLNIGDYLSSSPSREASFFLARNSSMASP
ncbi:hypothetical protein, partial [Aeromonas caviae]|uniref:hypothetical protein n=1 Tax=Aeromonas caviae TaxID=648 RepID=UPI004039BB78